jgi:hypothetical protein
MKMDLNFLLVIFFIHDTSFVLWIVFDYILLTLIRAAGGVYDFRNFEEV